MFAIVILTAAVAALFWLGWLMSLAVVDGSSTFDTVDGDR